MGEGYASKVKEAAGKVGDVFDRFVHSGEYLETLPVGEQVSEEGVDFGLFHNAVKEYATGSDMMRYQQVVDRAGAYVDEDRGEELSEDELTTLLTAALEVEMQAAVVARQYDNLEDVYSNEELVEKGLISKEVLEGWRELSDEEVEERETGRSHITYMARAERIRREKPRAADWYDTVQNLTERVELFVQHTLDDAEYTSVREEALQRAQASIERDETGRLETLLGRDKKGREE